MGNAVIGKVLIPAGPPMSLDEMQTVTRLNREKMEKEAKRMKREGKVAEGCEYCGLQDHNKTCKEFDEFTNWKGACSPAPPCGEHDDTKESQESESEAVTCNRLYSSKPLIEAQQHDDTKDITISATTAK
uniref:uncharacterized protein LOC105349472 n=1 Tax=Fragaria vesca subsp. vesca TaxID=101020 RepID=UPI0005CAEB32|nr:PREDICTED: uncharacterized protein LOC105349472 [Fragaria vesca subsp. vesca]